MTQIDRSSDLLNISRRRLFNLITLGTVYSLTKNFIFPATASANSEIAVQKELIEKYHIFIPYEISRRGGTQIVTLRSGETYQVQIPQRITENLEITIKGLGIEANDIILVLHTLYDPQLRIADKIYQEIDQADFLRKDITKERAKQTYELVEDVEYIKDTASIDLLHYLIASSKLDDKIRQRYEIASKNCQLIIIERTIESALNKSQLTEDKKKLLRGTFQYVRASEPVPNFSYLKELDTIIETSDIPIAIKRNYTLASAKSRALTVDIIIVNLIETSEKLISQEKANYLATYNEIRDGKKVSNQETLNLLNLFILNSDILESCKIVYLLAQERFFAQDVSIAQEDIGKILQRAYQVSNTGVVLVPTATNIISTLAVETATGVAISSLSGGAATTATLATLGGGSVAAGGLGMLGGLAVVTGGAALIGAAGLVSIALVSQMDGEDFKNLGIAGAAGTLAGAAAVLIAWTGASALGITGTLSGAAAITTIISALGGISVITGGAAFVAFGAGFVVFSFLTGHKDRDKNVLHHLESRIYTLIETPIAPSLIEFIDFLKNKLCNPLKIQGAFIAPDIPLDKLSNSLSTFGIVNADEQILALINTSWWNDAKEGVLLTNRRVIWKAGWEKPDFIYYTNLRYQNKELPKLSDEKENYVFYSLLEEIGQRYSSVQKQASSTLSVS